MSTQSKPRIVFAHGIWAAGSRFNKVIPTLQAEGGDPGAGAFLRHRLPGALARWW